MPSPGFNLDDYVTVNERLMLFRQEHPEWSLVCNLRFEGEAILARAEIADECERVIAVGHAEEIRTHGAVNRTSAVENAETSAWGRALANLGYEVRRSVASKEEMEKVSRARVRPRKEAGTSGKEEAAPTDNGSEPGKVSRSRREVVLPRDQALAKQAADLKISEEDRVDVIRAITKGRTDSGKDLEPAEVIWVATAYEELAAGDVALRRDKDGVVRIGRVRQPGGNNPGPSDEPF